MFQTEPCHSPKQKRAFPKLVVAIVLFLLTLLALAGGVLAERSRADFRATTVTATLPSSSPTPPAGLSGSFPPSEPQAAHSVEVAAGQSYINFDNVSSGTAITSQYSPFVFSTSFGWYLIAHNQFYGGQYHNYGSSPPNILDHYPTESPYAGYAPLYINFTQPVNGLKFYVVAVDDFRPAIAQLNIFQNGSSSPTATRNIPGYGYFYIPVPVDLGAMGLNNVTRIEIINITDTRGIGYDDFTYSVATPTPTPTPTPSPSPSPTPFAPTNLHGEGHTEEITLVWDLQANTTSYNLKRRASFDPNWSVIATGIQPTTYTSFGNTQFIGRYRDYSANPDIDYFYVVTAVNANGESPNSNAVSLMLAPSCGDFQPAQGPVQQFYPDPGNGWSLTASVAGSSGLVLTDVRLKDRYMAKMMSVPYFTVKTTSMSSPQPGQLTANSDVPTMRARLIRYSLPYGTSSLDNHVVFSSYIAEYAIDRLTPTSKSCLRITQEYEFRERREGDRCEPAGHLPCARFYPRVSYKFYGRQGETLQSINIPQRLHYNVEGSPQSTIGLFRDWDFPPLAPGTPTFQREANPLTKERSWKVVEHGRDKVLWDNIHQTNKVHTSHPMEESWLFWAGCPECVHTHWRWPWYLGVPQRYGLPFSRFGEGTGLPMIGKHSLFVQTDQDVEIGVVRYKPGEEDPDDFKTLIIGNENLINAVTRTTGLRRRTQIIQPLDVLYWYSGTSYEPDSDLFFKHGSFFSPLWAHQIQMENASAELPATQNGIKSITYGNVYEEGATNFSNIDPGTLPPLPPGYVALDNRAYQISTDAIVSGPHVAVFDVPTVTDETAFNNLAILYLEHDPFDPDNMVWVDSTILSPDSPAPNFAAKLINARVNDVGLFAIGTLVQPQPDPGSSDLSITSNHSPASAVVENSVSYSLRVINSGPQPSTDVGVVDILPSETTFVSLSSTQGTCKHKEGKVYCKLGTVPSGGIVDITVVANTFEDTTGIPAQGRSIINTAIVAGVNDDPNFDNNSATDSLLLLGHPNARPSVTIVSPTPGAAFAPSSPITITATATDSNGTVSKVDFYNGTTLLGTRTGTGPQYQLTFAPPPGAYSVIAVATDNGGRTNASNAVPISVNGQANITINSPVNDAVLAPGGNITVTATATGSVATVEIFANSIRLGQAAGSGSHSVTWANVLPGNYILTAVATDPSGATTTSAPVNITVTTRPTVAITSPVDGVAYPPLTKVTIVATTSDSDGVVSQVDFYANDTLIGTGSLIGQDRFAFDWLEAPTGIYSVRAVATDNLGVTATSASITIAINTPTPQPGEFIWFDDALPAGAVPHADGDVEWSWTNVNPGAYSGTKAHQSRSFGELNPPNSFHQHYFDGATMTLPVNPGDGLFTWVFLDPNDMPRQIMLQWKDASGWEHRAYWGENRIELGVRNTNSRRYWGSLPAPGQWTQLGIPASYVGLEGSTVTGMAFTLDGGRATFDLTGKRVANAPFPPPEPDETVWLEDGLPAGAIPAVVDDVWNWVPGPVFSGQSAHQSYFNSGDNKKFRSHSFTGAQTPMRVNAGETLFAYVYLGDPDLSHQPNTPDQIMLQWYDGLSWEHRAFWGENYIGQQIPSVGIQGTEAQRYMGGLPAARGWYRLEVPASYVGLEGKLVSGMGFSVFRNARNPFVTWDKAGKARRQTTATLPLSATSGVWRLHSNTYGYSYNTNDQGEPEHIPQKQNVFFAYPRQAPGTVPMHRFRRPTNWEYFYTPCRTCPGNDWQYEGIAFYVYPNAGTPNTVPLYLYHDNRSKYFLTIDQGEAAGMTFDGIWGYVYPTVPPAAPYFDPWWYLSCNKLYWRDNSGNESGFRVDQWDDATFTWVEAATTGPDATNALVQCSTPPWGHFRVRAFNSAGSSNGGTACTGCSPSGEDPPPNSAPTVSIAAPANGETVGVSFAITANAFDVNGNGTIPRVEFFANGNKIGESPTAPHIFAWNNVTPGSYTLTAKVTDGIGATATSEPVTITVSRLNQSITFDPISDMTYGDAPFAIMAEASSGLPVSFTVVSGAATVSGNNVTITGAGPVTVRASQPGDASYNAAANVDRTFNVAKAAATITLSNVNQTYGGSPKTVTATTSPANLTGVSITYDGSTTAPTNAGTYAIVASLTHANYSAANATGTLSVAGASQTISFTAPADKTYGDAPFALGASSSSNLPVSFSIVSGPATLSGNTLTITAAGSVTVRASQSGNANYNPAAAVDRTFNVAKASATITLSNLSHVYDGTVKNAVATTNPAGLSGVSISYSGPALTPINAGTYSVVATMINANYTAPNATASLTVTKADPVITWQSPADIPVGTPLTGTQLNATVNGVGGTFAYTPPAGTVLSVGNNQTLSVTFTPTISANYNTVSKTVSINVATAVPLSDDFNDNSLDSSRWTVVVPNSPLTVSEQGQQLRITIPPHTSGYNGIVSTSTYDLRGSTVEVEMAQPISQAGWCENFIQVSLDAANYFLIDAGAGSMVFRSMIAGNNDQTVLPVFNPVEHRYWRIRHDQGTSTIYFETSPDRVIWTSRKSAAVGFSLTAMRVHLLAGAWGTGNSNPGWAAFDNVRLVTNETANALPIANSGFELPVLAANGYQYAPTGGAWTFTSGGGVTGNSSGFTAANAPAPELNQVAFLQGGAASTISQPVAGFQANTSYVVTFAAAQRAYYTGQDFQVYLDSVLLGTFRPTSMGYVYYSTAPFSTTAGTHTLKFVGLNSSGGDNTAFIDNVRITQSSAVQSVSLFSDEFNSTSLDATKWTVTDPARVTANGQQLQIALLPNTAAYHTAYSNSTYNLTGRSVQVELAEPISQAGWCENYILVMLDGNNYLLLHSGSGSMVFRSMVNGANDQTVVHGFNPAVHHYWRIRHDQVSNTIKFETSPDAVTWTIYKSAAAGFSLTSLRFYLYAGCWGTGNGNPGAAKFDNFRFLDPAYLDSPVTLPGTIEIENYDNGDTGLGYYDTSPGTHGQDYDQPPNYPPPTFRQPTNVDLYKANTAYSSRYLIVLQAGDWMKYSVNVTQAGNYTLYARIAWGGAPGGTFHIEVDGIDKTGPIQIPDTGWSLQMISRNLQLPSGLHSVKVVADTNAANGCTGDIDYLYFRLNP